MKLSAELQALSERIHYRFQTPALLIEATTHSSMNSAGRRDNQRLEFLGDRVLGLVIAEVLLNRDESANEGLLAPRLNALVRKETCAAIAQKIQLGDVLKMGRSEMLSGGRRKQAILGDAMEALIAAIYCDGGFKAAERIILKLWQPDIESAQDDARDAKTRLQEWAQGQGMKPPHYSDTGRTGPDHAPVFSVEVHVQSGQKQQASAGSKRSAQQIAAQKLLDLLEGKA